MQAETSSRQPRLRVFSPLLTRFILSLPFQRYRQPASRQWGWNEDLWGLRKLLGLDPGVSLASGWFYWLTLFIDLICSASQWDYERRTIHSEISTLLIRAHKPAFLVSDPLVFVLLQGYGHHHGDQPALHPTAALHCWRALLVPHLWGHRCYRLRWECILPPPTPTFLWTFQRTDGVIMFFLCVCLPGIWHCFWEYQSLSGNGDPNVTISDIGFHADFSIYLQLSQTWLVFSAWSTSHLSLNLKPCSYTLNHF